MSDPSAICQDIFAPWPDARDDETRAAAWALRRAGGARLRCVPPGASCVAPPAADEILIWTGCLRNAVDHDAIIARFGLDASERERLSRLRRPADRCGYLAAHAVLRWLLAEVTGLAPAALRFDRTSAGKPYLVAMHPDTLSFSISHSGALAAVALARAPVGVDIETGFDGRDVMAIARRHFSARHVDELEARKGAARLRLFARQWTLGEAFIKATGLGLHQTLDGFSFSSEGPPRLVEVETRWGPPDAWCFGTA